MDEGISRGYVDDVNVMGGLIASHDVIRSFLHREKSGSYRHFLTVLPARIGMHR